MNLSSDIYVGYKCIIDEWIILNAIDALDYGLKYNRMLIDLAEKEDQSIYKNLVWHNQLLKDNAFIFENRKRLLAAYEKK